MGGAGQEAQPQGPVHGPVPETCFLRSAQSHNSWTTLLTTPDWLA